MRDFRTQEVAAANCYWLKLYIGRAVGGFRPSEEKPGALRVFVVPP
jgi:hypothetical protein